MDDNIFRAKNSWRSGRLPAAPFFKRTIYQLALDLVQQPRILLVFGPRRSGKTTLLKELARLLISKKSVEPKRIFYFDLDTMDCGDVLNRPGTLLEFCGIRPESPPEELIYVLIDEVQRLPDPGLFLKALYDIELPLRIVVTGSSGFRLQIGTRQSLVGRSTSLFLYPLSPPEIPLDYSYLRWGGFPEVLLAENDASRQEYLADMWAAYVDKEIGGFMHVQKVDRFKAFTQLLAEQAGQLVNLNELSNTLQISRDTAGRYLSFLQQTFLIRDLRPYTGSRRGELTKMPKVFFSDPGLLNLLAGHGGEIPAAVKGGIWENAVEIILRHFGGDLFFWRTDRGAEVDFVWRHKGEIIPVEVKAGSMQHARITRGYRSFLQTYKPLRGIIVNESFDKEAVFEGTSVRFVPLVSLPSILMAY